MKAWPSYAEVEAERTSRKHTALCFVDAKPQLFRNDFRAWVDENWHVYEEFERRAVRLGQGHRHIGAKSIWESIRFASAVRELSGEFKLNNTYTADCARLSMEMNPSLKGRFETRLSPLSRRSA